MGSSLRSFLSELKRRRVYRVAAVYAAVAFVIWQAAEIAVPALGLPDWVLTAVVVATLVGFPIALILGWAFDVTPEGVRVTEPVDREGRPTGRRRAAVALLGVGVMLALAVGAVLLFPRGGPALDRQRVAVSPFENETGRSALDPVGRMAQDWITGGLARTGVVGVVPTSAARESFQYVAEQAGVVPDLDRVRSLGEETGAGVIVWGSYYAERDSLRFQVQITDAARRELLSVLDPVSGPIDAPSEAIEVLRQRVMGALASHLNPRLDRLVDVSVRPPTFDAYLEYAEGMELFHGRRDWRGSLTHFYRAAALDTTFFAPLVAALSAHYNLREYAAVDSLLEVLDRSRERLAPPDRFRMDGLRAQLRGDREAAYRNAKEAAVALGMTWDYTLATAALAVNRPGEAVEALLRANPDRGALRGWAPYWRALAVGSHALGDHRRELEAIREGRRRHPELRSMVWYEVQALAALGRVEEVSERLEEFVTLPEQRGYSEIGLMRLAVYEYRAHGHAEAERAMLARALGWYEAQSAEYMRPAGSRYGLLMTLYRAERWEEAEVLARELVAESPDNLSYLGYLGTLAARRGDREGALEISEQLAGLDRPYLYGSHTYQRACIAAVLGDREEAVRALRESFAQGRGYTTSLHRDIDLEPLRDYQPFQEFMRPKG